MDKVLELAREARLCGDPKDLVPLDIEQITRFYTLARADLEAEVKRLEAGQYRPAPCHKFCEANAFKIEIRGLEAENAKLRDALHNISLCSQNSMSSQRQCGEIARAALGENK